MFAKSLVFPPHTIWVGLWSRISEAGNVQY